MTDDGPLIDQLVQAMGSPARDVVIDLAGCLVRFRVAESAVAVLERFELVSAPGSGHADFEVTCIPPKAAPVAVRGAVAVASSRTARGRNLRRGYYATDNFGPPAEMVSDGRRFVVIAHDPEPIVWSYLVKHLLLRWSLEHRSLFLKGAAVDWNGAGILLIARGGGGKTTMAMALARLGGGLIANSHVLVAGGSMTGVATTMRVREPDASAPGGTTERLVAPSSLYSSPASRSVPLSLVCLVARAGGPAERVERLPGSVAMPVLTAFALGHDVYRLEEDLLDDVDGDYDRFGRAYQQMQSGLLAITGSCPVVRVDHDVLRPGGSEALAEALSAAVQAAR